MIEFLEYIITEKRTQMLTASEEDRDRLDLEIKLARRKIEELGQ